LLTPAAFERQQRHLFSGVFSVSPMAFEKSRELSR
jgi:hypothetical protein